MANRWIGSILWLVLVLSMFTLTSPLAFAVTFTTIDVPGAMQTDALAINDHGQIVCAYFDGSKDHGFLLDNGVFTTIDVPGSTRTQPPRHQCPRSDRGCYVDSQTIHGFLAVS